LVYWSS